MLESKRRALIFISLAILLAVIAGFMFLKKVQALNTDLGQMSKVYVASEDISSRSVIQPNQVKVKELPNQYISSSYITNTKDLVNKVSTVPLSKGDVITKNMLKPAQQLRDENDRLVAMFASDKVRFDQTLQANDRADIIVNQTVDNKPETEVFMTDVKVAMVSASKKSKMQGVAFEVPFDKASDLIHMETYADGIRVLKSNVGKPSTMSGQEEHKKAEEKTSKDDEKKKEEKAKQEQGNKAKHDKANEEKDKKKQDEKKKQGDKKKQQKKKDNEKKDKKE